MHTVWRFDEFLAAGAAAHGAALHPHLLPELSAQLVVALAPVDGVAEPMVEDVGDARFSTLGALRCPLPVVIGDGVLTEQPHLWLGLQFTSL